MQEIVVTVVNRLRHWPISIVFEQWKEYTARQSEFKLLTTKMNSIHQELALKQYFSSWIQYHKEMKLAKHHYVSFKLNFNIIINVHVSIEVIIFERCFSVML